VCETARSTPVAVEAGVWTYEPHRRKGLAAAVTATWAGLVDGRTAFYGTSWDNHGSQAVARRLGLMPLGQWWQLYRREGRCGRPPAGVQGLRAVTTPLAPGASTGTTWGSTKPASVSQRQYSAAV